MISEVIGQPRGSPAFNHSGTGHISDHPRMIHRLPANYINYFEYIYIYIYISIYIDQCNTMKHEANF